MADLMGMVFDLDQQILRFQILDDGFARLKPVLSLVRSGLIVHTRVVIHDVDRRQLVPPPDFEVVGVVCRGDLQRAGAELGIDVSVFDDRQLAFQQGQDNGFAGLALVARVFRVDGDRGIAQHGFRTRGGDDQGAVPVLQRVFDVVEMPGLFLVFDFEVGQRGVTARTPVDDVVALVDQPFFIQRDEHLAHRARQPFVHREPVALPVERTAQLHQLVVDGAAGFLFPLPDALDELLAAEFLTVRAFGLELAFDHVLCGDAGVVRPWLPQSVDAAHSLPARHDVLQGVVERMAHVQGAGDVGRRDGHGKGFAVTRFVGVRQTVLVPILDPPLLDLVRLILFVQLYLHCPLINQPG